MDKLAALNEILQLDPANAFARYGLAMEHVARGNSEAALAEFAACIQHNPDYVPAYQMSAQTLVTLVRQRRSPRTPAPGHRRRQLHPATSMPWPRWKPCAQKFPLARPQKLPSSF